MEVNSTKSLAFLAKLAMTCIVLAGCANSQSVGVGDQVGDEPAQGIDAALAGCDATKITPPPEGAIDEYEPYGTFLAGPDGEWTKVDLESAKVSGGDGNAGSLTANNLERSVRIRQLDVEAVRAGTELADELWIRRQLENTRLLRAVAFVDGRALFVGMCAETRTTDFSAFIRDAIANETLELRGIDKGASSETVTSTALADLVSNPGGPTDRLLSNHVPDVEPEWADIDPDDRRLDPDEMPPELYEKLVLQTFVFASVTEQSEGLVCFKAELGWLSECVASSAPDDSDAYITTMAVEHQGGFLELSYTPSSRESEETYSVGGALLPEHTATSPTVVWITWATPNTEFRIEVLSASDAIKRGEQPGVLSDDQITQLKGQLENFTTPRD